MSSQRDAYVPPTGAGAAGGYAGATAIPTGSNTGALEEGPTINYICGDCNSKVPLKRADAIRCRECGHRVLYKERTKRYAILDEELAAA